VGLEVLNGYAFKSKNFISSKSGNNELPVLKIKNVANGNTNHNDVVFHKVSFSLEKYIIKKGDTLIALTGNHPFAKTQVVGGVSKYRLPIKSLLNQRVAKIFSKEKSMLHNEILYYFFKWNNTQFHIGNQSSGSASQANISKNDLLNIPINLPPLPEQVAIAKILTVFDDKIELLQAQNKTLETTAQTIFKEWFGKYQIGDELPDGWRLGKLGEVVDVFDSKRIPLSKAQREEKKGKYRYFGATSVMDYVDDFLFDGIYLLFAEDGSVIDNIFAKPFFKNSLCSGF
jgi:type I restriction enzyme S subunit